jgi:A118 family predicted phage portal protein
MNVLRRIWEAVKKLFTRTKISGAVNSFEVKPAINGETLERLQLWSDMWKGQAYWINKDVESLHIEQDITKEFANTATNEMTVTISDKALQQIFDRSVRNLSEELQEGLASGAMVIKPLGENKVQFISQFDFLPTEYDSEKRLTGVIFPDCRKVGDLYYTRLEYHRIDDKGLTIVNKAYVSNYENDLGRETSLEAIEDWAKLPQAVTYPGVNRPIYGYYRNPIKNTIDGSNAGVSIYESAVSKIKRADIQADRLDWEFESGERRIHVDAQAIKLDENGVTALDSRLYKGLELMQSGEELYKEYSPALRQKDIIEGLEEQKREIEFSVGLAYGDLSNANNVEKTATEMKVSKQRKYNTVTAIQENLKDCLEDLCFGLAFFNGKINSGYEFACTFNDSITTDEETERKQDMQDVSMGVMSLVEYRMKWYGEDEKTAASKLPQSAEVIP